MWCLLRDQIPVCEVSLLLLYPTWTPLASKLLLTMNKFKKSSSFSRTFSLNSITFQVLLVNCACSSTFQELFWIMSKFNNFPRPVGTLKEVYQRHIFVFAFVFPLHKKHRMNWNEQKMQLQFTSWSQKTTFPSTIHFLQHLSCSPQKCGSDNAPAVPTCIPC